MKGILFKPWKIKAIAEGGYEREWQTRRVIKPQPDEDGGIDACNSVFDHNADRFARFQVGDIVYIKETHKFSFAWEGTKPRDIPPSIRVYYKDSEADIPLGKWRSPLFMPKWAARYFIQITDVKAEKLQEINKVRHDDVLKEGYPFGYDVATLNEHPITTYARLWDSINKEHQWADNPYVWVYSFKLTREGR